MTLRRVIAILLAVIAVVIYTTRNADNRIHPATLIPSEPRPTTRQ